MSLRYERAIKLLIEKNYAFSLTYDFERSLSVTKSLQKLKQQLRSVFTERDRGLAAFAKEWSNKTN